MAFWKIPGNQFRRVLDGVFEYSGEPTTIDEMFSVYPVSKFPGNVEGEVGKEYTHRDGSSYKNKPFHLSFLWTFDGITVDVKDYFCPIGIYHSDEKNHGEDKCSVDIRG